MNLLGKMRVSRTQSGRVRAALLFVAGYFGVVGLMAHPGGFVGSMWLALVALAIATVGSVALAQPTMPLDAKTVDLCHAEGSRPAWSRPRFTLSIALVVVNAGFLLLAATRQWQLLPWVIAAGLLPLVASAWFSPAWLVFVVTTGLFLPTLGAFSLIDPWETHYGEVAREILVRDDWISLWWAQDFWFWSKPILIFWLEALSMGLLGVDASPDANPAHPEWAIRLPHYLLAVGAAMAIYATAAKLWSRRAGVLCALVLVSSPYYFLISHQAITDLPLVTLLTVAMCLLTLAITTAPQAEAPVLRCGRYRLSATHLLLAALAVVILPQSAYLISRNLTVSSAGLAFHPDRFLYGSGANPEVPGNPAHQIFEPVFGAWYLQPAAQGLVWLIGFIALVLWISREKRLRSLYMWAFYLACALAFMAKGLPGIALPGLAALVFLLASKRWQLLLSGDLRIASGIVLITVASLPWFVAMYIRHGAAFTDRLIVHDHINRLAQGVHGDTGTVQYFIEQLGIGFYPWIALLPAAVGYWYLKSWQQSTTMPQRAQAQQDTVVLWGSWLLSAFVLFSAMITKFHHYAFPVVPPAAFLVGLMLDRMIPESVGLSRPRHNLSLLLAAAASICIALAFASLVGDVRGKVPTSVPPAQRTEWVLAHSSSPWLSAALAVAGIALGVVACRKLKFTPRQADHGQQTSVVAAAAIAVCIASFAGRDLAWVTDVRPAGYERLLQLFIYRYDRVWPTTLDYRPVLTGTVITSALLLAALVWRTYRMAVVSALLGLALAFAAWGVNVYLIDVAPHWGQRELVKRYYRLRTGPDEPLVAWQMNWKGENFYTGNRLPVFVELDNKAIKAWLASHKGQRAFFILEPTRLAVFKNVLGPERPFKQLSTTDENNKFVLVSAQL